MNIVQRHPVVPTTGRFAFSEAPIPGESLMGFIARNADIHGVDKVSSALLPAGLENPKTEAFATAYEEQADVLAALFMTTPEEMRSRMYLPWAGREGTEVNFHGTHIRPKYLRWRHRRFSPASLRVSGHHRAMWDLAVLSFCLESKETLVSGCPSCGESLGWRYTLGIGTCEWCGADLAKVAGVPVRCDDMEALDFACGLVNPDPATREKALARVPERLAALDAGELFEFVMNLACLLLTGPDAPRLARLQSREDLAQVTPDILGRAGRLVLGWPATMRDLAAGMRAQARQRPGRSVATGDLRPMRWLAKEQAIAPLARQAVAEIIEAHGPDIVPKAERPPKILGEFITKHEAAQAYGFRGAALDRMVALGVIRGSVRERSGKGAPLFHRKDLADLRAEMGDVTTRVDAARVLGVDYLGVERLADAGLLRRTGPATAVMVYGDHYRASSVTALRQRLLALPTRCVGAEAPRSLSAVAGAASTPVVPWVGLIQAMLSGQLPVVKLSADPDLPVAEALGIQERRGWSVADLPAEAMPRGDGRRINSYEAGGILETPAPCVSSLTKAGALPRDGSGEFTLVVDDVLAFRSRCISTREVARRVGRNANATWWQLTRLGVPVTFSNDSRKVVFWDRAAAEAAFDRLREG